MKTLDEIFLEHKTDKASTTHDYAHVYERYLQSWVDKEFTLLEIGVGSGGSLKSWKEFFPNAKIYGIDNNADLAGEDVFIGSQSDLSFLQSVIDKIGGIDVVVDDGSHVGDDMVTTFKFIFPLLRSGGFYFIEDCHSLYNNHYSGDYQPNGRTAGYNFFTDLPYHIDVAGRAMCGKRETAIDWPMPDPPVPEYSRILNAAHFHSSLWVFEKL